LASLESNEPASSSDNHILARKVGSVSGRRSYYVHAREATGAVELLRGLVESGPCGGTDEDAELVSSREREAGGVGGGVGRIDTGYVHGEGRIIAVLQEGEELVLGLRGVGEVRVVSAVQGIFGSAPDSGCAERVRSGVTLASDERPGGRDVQTGSVGPRERTPLGEQ